MKLTKSTATVFELDNGDTILGTNHSTFFVRASGLITEYYDSEMTELYGLTDDQIANIRYSI